MGLFSKHKTEEQEAADAAKRAEKEQKKAAAKAQQDERREQELAKLDAKARGKALKKGLDVEGALIVSHDLSKDAAWETLMVWPDHIEKHNHGKVGSLLGSGKGVESMPIANVTSVQASNDGVYGKLEVHGSGNSITFRASQSEARKIRSIVMDLMQVAKTSPSPAASAAPSLAEQIKQLGELRDAGLVSEEEFEAKRKELLDRM